MDKLLQHCPISGRQILNPVKLPQSDCIYERNCVEYNLKGQYLLSLYSG